MYVPEQLGCIAEFQFICAGSQVKGRILEESAGNTRNMLAILYERVKMNLSFEMGAKLPIFPDIYVLLQDVLFRAIDFFGLKLFTQMAA